MAPRCSNCSQETHLDLKFNSRLAQLLNFQFELQDSDWSSRCSMYGKSFTFLDWLGSPGKKALKLAESDSSSQPGSRRRSAKSARTNPEVIPPSLLAKTTSHHSLQSALQLGLPQPPTYQPEVTPPSPPTHLNYLEYLPTYLPCQDQQ